MTSSLKNSLSRLYYTEACDQRGWAYFPLDTIFENKALGIERILIFRKGHQMIRIKLMESIVIEIEEICKQSGGSNERPVSIFDYLAFFVGQKEKYDDPIVANPTALCWVKLRGNGGKFSTSQAEALEQIKLPLALVNIDDVFASPRKIQINWDIRTGEKWLDEIDDLREQTEYDDEYY